MQEAIQKVIDAKKKLDEALDNTFDISELLSEDIKDLVIKFKENEK